MATINFEYEWNGLVLDVEAEFSGQYRPATGCMSVREEAEYPQLDDLSVVIGEDAVEFDIENIYRLEKIPAEAVHGSMSNIIMKNLEYYKVVSLEDEISEYANEQLAENGYE